VGRRVRPFRCAGEYRGGRPTETPGTAVTPGLTDGLATTPPRWARVAEPDEIARAVTFLASEDAGYINGAILHATGGQLAIAP